eukprot:TRINITY_DN29477_c0_g1_i1.p1 TRINITY_DN29477_c0_g1~~TRINITY_DN29477_c0_g1_i1.p1  ORF type:complete len:645 (+),score=166.39 TRINITY_DN29477_c0_g1_i1:88-1935(+)
MLLQAAARQLLRRALAHQPISAHPCRCALRRCGAAAAAEEGSAPSASPPAAPAVGWAPLRGAPRRVLPLTALDIAPRAPPGLAGLFPREPGPAPGGEDWWAAAEQRSPALAGWRRRLDEQPGAEWWADGPECCGEVHPWDAFCAVQLHPGSAGRRLPAAACEALMEAMSKVVDSLHQDDAVGLPGLTRQKASVDDGIGLAAARHSRVLLQGLEQESAAAAALLRAFITRGHELSAGCFERAAAMLVAAGSIARAEEVLPAMDDAGVGRTVAVYNALLLASRGPDDCARGLAHLEAMRRRRLQPDSESYHNLLSACALSRAGRTAAAVWNALAADSQVKPARVHGNAVLAALVRLPPSESWQPWRLRCAVGVARQLCLAGDGLGSLSCAALAQAVARSGHVAAAAAVPDFAGRMPGWGELDADGHCAMVGLLCQHGAAEEGYTAARRMLFAGGVSDPAKAHRSWKQLLRCLERVADGGTTLQRAARRADLDALCKLMQLPQRPPRRSLPGRLMAVESARALSSDPRSGPVWRERREAALRAQRKAARRGRQQPQQRQESARSAHPPLPMLPAGWTSIPAQLAAATQALRLLLGPEQPVGRGSDAGAAAEEELPLEF